MRKHRRAGRGGLRAWIGLSLLVGGAAVPVLGAEASRFQTYSELAGLRLAMTPEQVRASRGEPGRVLDRGLDTIWVYFPEAHPGTYLAVAFPAQGHQQVHSLQISGLAGAAFPPFVGLRLGDYENQLAETLGRPSSRRPVPEIGGELLSYYGTNLTVESQSQQVFSIRISLGLERGFRKREGQEAFDRGDYAQALAEYEALAALTPEDPDAYYRRGLARSIVASLADEPQDAACADFAQAAALSPDEAISAQNWDLHLRLGRCKLHQKDFTGAAEIFTDPRPVVEAGGDVLLQRILYELLESTEAGRRDFRLAIDWAERQLALQPGDAATMERIAGYYERLGDPGKARRWYQQATRAHNRKPPGR